jgi:hypothetical protein
MSEAVMGILAIGATFALVLHGWPRLFTINVHKHYHGKDEEVD